jgi:hypothetical protein
MKKQGAIILGIGGDNSKGAAGTFYEGVMTTGFPTAATEAAVQANIVAAGYGTGTGGGGATGTIVSGVSGTDEYMRGTGRLLRADVEKVWGPGWHLAGNNTFSYFLDPHGPPTRRSGPRSRRSSVGVG